MAQLLEIGGGGGGVTVNNKRGDYSVNGARVDGLLSETPVLCVGTMQAAAGAYNGGGSGNKAIMGSTLLPAGTPLGALQSVRYELEQLAPVDAALTGQLACYVTIQVDLGQDLGGGRYCILNILNHAAGVNTGIYSGVFPQSIGDWSPSLPGGDLVSVVNFQGMWIPSVPPPPATQLVLPTIGPVPPPTSAWPASGYKISDILAVYPNAVLYTGNINDGGNPKNTVMPPILLVMGDSGNHTLGNMRVKRWLINGQSA